MKKLVFLMAICLVPNFVMAEGEWPVFSNQENAEQSLENLMVIGANNDKSHLIGGYEYTIASFTCNALVDEANKDKSTIAEFRPGEVLAEAGTTYNLYLGDALVEGTDTVIERKIASEEEKVEIPLDAGNSNDVEADDKKPASKKGYCNLL
jgi:hypothetical protein